MTQETTDKNVDQTRRRLTQGGLATPVVLASLLSKDALATNVAYRCSVSGKLSNNTSAKGPNKSKTDADCKLGKSQSDYIGQCSTTWSLKNTKLKDLGLANKYFYNGSYITSSSLSPNTPATVKQLLTLSGDAAYLDYAKKALVVFLNAYELNSSGGGYTSYPLAKSEAVLAFNAIANNGGCTIRSFNMDNTVVRNYLDRLFY